VTIEYTNRKGDIYYLHAGKTRTGRPKYYFSRDPDGDSVDSIPAGFEIYESPEAGLVYLRNLKPVAVAPFEREMVCDGVRRYAKLEHFLVDVQGNDLTVYLPAVADDLPSLLAEARGLFSVEKIRAETDRLMCRSPYVKMMRFVLVDEDERMFRAERWCFRGAIDDWIRLDGPATLAKLVGKYVKHLGQKSFFDLV
jgi:hypothetical protein